MSGPGYTYSTVTARIGEPVHIRVSFYLDSDAWIHLVGAEDDRPHLTVAHGDVSVSIGPQAGQVTAEDARIARHLADQAAEYAAVIERLSAATSEAPKPGAATEAAGDPAA
jgi:hypothetical protein